MKCTYHWLKDFVEFDFSPEELADRLTMLGLEVDSYETVIRNIDNAVVGEIVDRIDFDTYEVNIGKKKIEVEYGGWQIPNGTRVVVINQGGKPFLASYKDINISDSSDLIYIEDSTSPGTDLGQIIPKVDVVYDIDLTPNRPDCLSIVGIAREISTLTGNPLRIPEISVKEDATPASDFVKVVIETAEGCPRYAARVIRNVKIGPSPLWMQDRLVKVGLRCINNIVDVTNYVMMELGHPLHAFDYHFIQGHEIRVRLSQHGEHFVTLDGKGHTLDDSTVLICDAKRPVALGGIMGGENSEVTEETKDILLECAYFTPSFIRRSISRLGISTDASMRFSRGADPNGVERAINRTAQLFAETASGTVLSGIVDRYVAPIGEKEVLLRPSRVNHVLGMKINDERIQSILENLGCKIEPSQDESVKVFIPTFRPDLEREIDLIEEISRVIGYDNIPEKIETSFQLSADVNDKEKLLASIRNFWIGYGFSEAISNSMIPSSDYCLRKYPGETIRLKNPLSEDMALLRPSLIPSLLRMAQYNLFRQQESVRLFEIGNTFQPVNQQKKEYLRLGVVVSGRIAPRNWKTDPGSVDFFHLKGYVSAFLRKFGFTEVEFSEIEHWWLAKPVVLVKCDGTDLGIVGAVDESLLESYDIQTPLYIFELNLTEFLPKIKKKKQFIPVPKFPAVVRDLAFVLDIDIPGGKLLNEIKKWGGTYLKELELFDVYMGKQVPVGKKSMAVSMVFQAEEKTLTEEEINITVDRIIEKVGATLNAELRS